MASSSKKPSEQAPRVIDPSDPLHAAVENLFVGMSPTQRAEAMIDFVQSLGKTAPSDSTEDSPEIGAKRLARFKHQNAQFKAQSGIKKGD
ncbi:hypothetical protein [Roseateles violae]|uniref:Uncharacterized protein n=1 Tax=Roseateles violae TaxID=3058042 RepID=A0ABT8DS11_9BURK|nr:hypothetical protein [Pelomonas sp. PFR6]MDN3919112.1 hypothetical protein [Pelomonas sp. PFR6]